MGKEINIIIKAKDLASTTLTKVKGHFGIFGKSADSAEKDLAKLNKAARGTNDTLFAMERFSQGDILGGIRASAAALSEKLGGLGKAIGGVLAGFGIGWQVGTWIRDVKGLGKALDNLVVPANIAAKSVREMTEANMVGFRAQVQATEKSMDDLGKKADEAAKKVAVAISARMARTAQAGQAKEAAAPEEDKPIVAAETRVELAKDQLSLAKATKEEQQKAAQSMDETIAAQRTALAIETESQAKAMARYKIQQRTGTLSAESIADIKTSQAKIEEITKHLERLQKAKDKQADAVTEADTAIVEAETNVARAIDALTEANAKKVEDAANKRDKLEKERTELLKSEADKRAEIVQEEADAWINTQREAAQEAQAIAEKAGEDARNRLDARRNLGDAGSREFRDNMRAEEKRDKRIAKLNAIRGQLGIGATQFGQTKLEDLSAEGLAEQERFAKIMKRLGLKGAASPEDINKAAARKGIGLSTKDAELIRRASEQLKNEEAEMLGDHFKQLAANIEKADKEARAKKQAMDIAESKDVLKNIEVKIDKLGAVV